MPLVRIDLIQGQSSDCRRTIGEVVYDAMIEIFSVPKGDLQAIQPLLEERHISCAAKPAFLSRPAMSALDQDGLVILF
jgi:hypothetical protein